MKLNVNQWSEIEANKPVLVDKGLLHIRTTDPMAKLYAENEQGEKVLIGTGSDIRITSSEEVMCVIETNEKVYRYEPPVKGKPPQGEIFTNADRLPMESGTLAAVRGAAREMQLQVLLQKREMIREARRAAFLARRQKEREEEEEAGKQKTASQRTTQPPEESETPPAE